MNDWVELVRKICAGAVISGLLTGLIFLMAYRYCEQAGPEAAKACTTAIITASVAGLVAFWSLFNKWNKELMTGVMVIVIGGWIRVLIGFVGVVVVLVFMDINRKWFLACFGLFYTVFLLTSLWITVRLFQYRTLKENRFDYEQFRDVACQHGSARRNHQ
jgi:hypothetical protein